MKNITTELINFGANAPLKLVSYNEVDIPKRVCNNLEFIFVLKGEITLTYNTQNYFLKEDALFLINTGTIYSILNNSPSIYIILTINAKNLNIKNLNTYHCNSSQDNDIGKYYNIKRLIAKLVKTNSQESSANTYFNSAIAYQLLYELDKNFKSINTSISKTQKYQTRLLNIINYIEENYSKQLSLKDLANREFLSVPYLSSFFDKYLGVNFTTYCSSVRLEHALSDLLTTDNTIENIAVKNGFGDPRAFVTVFKKKYNTSPTTYRKNEKSKIDNSSNTFVDLEENSSLYLLAKYLHSQSKQPITQQIQNTETKYINKEKISINDKKATLHHTFKKFTSVGRAKELLFKETQDMLRELQNDIHYEYIKFHGLLSDDMLVYSEDANGNPHYSFMLIDKALDFLQSIDIKPLIQFSFMPLALASDKDKNVYAMPFNISPPKDIKKWNDLIYALMQHLQNRYGIETIKSWLYCVWNEPDTSEFLFGFKNDEDFFTLYKETYNVVKSISKDFAFGTPSLLPIATATQEWFKNFILWAKDNKCTPDFININYYDNDFSDESVEKSRPAQPAHNRLNKDEDAFSKFITNIKNIISTLDLSNIPIYLTEWNLTVSHRNLLNDTCFKSCYLTKNLLENYDKLDSFGYWVLTDFLEELQPSNEQFHGGLGLFTIDGIKKPHYYALNFLNSLGNTLIDSGDGYFITRSSNKIQIILYNYQHFGHLFASGETFDMTFTERYTPFSTLSNVEIALELTDIQSKKCTVQEHIINQQHGSAFDEWVKMGIPQLSKTEIDYLKQISIPQLKLQQVEPTNNSLKIVANLEPLEVRLIEISL